MVVLSVACSGFVYVATYGVNVPWTDEWDELPRLLGGFADGSLGIQDLWRQHNEHRIFFPALIFVGLGAVTNGNVVAFMYFTQSMLTAMLAIYGVAFRHQFSTSRDAWLMVPIALLVFSLRQWDNMLWGFQIAFVMVMLAAVLTFWCLSQVRNERYGAMLVCSALATTVGGFSSIQGLLIGPVGLLQLAVAPLNNRLKIVLTTSWAILVVVLWLGYFHGWHRPGIHPPLGVSLTFLFAAIGSSLASYPAVASAIGVVLILLAFMVITPLTVRRRWAEQSFWLATMAFSALTMAAIMAGRVRFGIEHAVSSRYATFSVPFAIAVYVLLIARERAAPTRVNRAILVGMVGLILAGTGVAFVEGIRIGKGTREYKEYQQIVLGSIDSQPDVEVRMHPTVEVVRKGATILQKLNHGVFTDPDMVARSRLPDPSLPVLEGSTSYCVEKVVVEKDPAFLTISGWAIDSRAGDTAGGLAVIINGQPHVAVYGLRRKDVARTLGSRKFAASGFRCHVPVKDVPPGRLPLTLKIQTRDHQAMYDVSGELEFIPAQGYVFKACDPSPDGLPRVHTQ